MLYVPKPFENNDIDQLHQFIERYNFATLISQNNDSELNISHIPVVLERDQGEHGVLVWHLAKLNGQAEKLVNAKNVLCIFHGPHAYISPAWYASSPNVPTWNYAVVHAQGVPVQISQEQLSDHLSKLLEYHEGKLVEKTAYKIPDEYKSRLLNNIIGFRMKITYIEGKFKLGQNRGLEDQHGMLKGLRKQNNGESFALAGLIEELISKQ